VHSRCALISEASGLRPLLLVNLQSALAAPRITRRHNRVHVASVQTRGQILNVNFKGRVTSRWSTRRLERRKTNRIVLRVLIMPADTVASCRHSHSSCWCREFSERSHPWNGLLSLFAYNRRLNVTWINAESSYAPWTKPHSHASFRCTRACSSVYYVCRRVSRQAPGLEGKPIPVTGHGDLYVCETSRLSHFLHSRLIDISGLSDSRAGRP
jgi:hypothetical protein